MVTKDKIKNNSKPFFKKRIKTRKEKKAFESTKPKRFEDEKKIMLIKGSTCCYNITRLMKNIFLLKKPFSTFFNKKNNWHPFDDQSNIEFYSNKNDFSLFIFGSHTKKRPNNLIMGRTYNHQVLDMVEFGIENIKFIEDFKISKTTLGIKPILIFSGQLFNDQDDYKRIQNLFIDLFSANKQTELNLDTLEQVIYIIALEDKILFRSYKIVYKKSGINIPRIELEEMGPHFDMVIRRLRLASKDLFKKACFQKYSQKAKKIKNKEKTNLGDSMGRIHMERQDYNKLNNRKFKGLNKKSFKEKRLSEDNLDENTKKIKLDHNDSNK